MLFCSFFGIISSPPSLGPKKCLLLKAKIGWSPGLRGTNFVTPQPNVLDS